MSQREKFLQYILFLLIFLIPLQTRYFFVAEQLNGAYWEYGSSFLYATEILSLLLLGIILSTPVLRNRRKILRPEHVALLLLPILSVLWHHAPSNILGAFHFGMAWLMLFFVAVLVPNRRMLLSAITASAVVQSILAIVQFVTQYIPANSLLGIAEKMPSTQGVSIVGTMTERLLRSHGTFPHPNILGGFLVIGIIAAILLYQQETRVRLRYLLLCTHTVITIALFLTFSRSAWIAAIIGVSYVLILNRKKIPWHSITTLTATVLIIGTLLAPILAGRLTITDTTQYETQSRNERISYISDASALLQAHFFSGVGLQGYTQALAITSPNKPAWAYQPVHTIYLLSMIEWGSIVAILFWSALGISIKKNKAILILLLPLLLIGIFDHYLLTQLSGLQMLFLATAVTYSPKVE